MRILGVVIQTKKGETLLSFHCSQINNRQLNTLSRLSFKMVVQMFANKKKVGRSFLVNPDILCITNISREIILQVFTHRL